jgi:hypothetical protein
MQLVVPADKESYSQNLRILCYIVGQPIQRTEWDKEEVASATQTKSGFVIKGYLSWIVGIIGIYSQLKSIHFLDQKNIILEITQLKVIMVDLFGRQEA